MKKILTITLITTLLFGCSDNKERLYIYNWADYIDQDVISEFEKEYNCRVYVDQFDDNEAMLAKLLAGITGYDIIFPSSYTIDSLRKNNLIEELDIVKLQNVFDNFDYKFSDLVYNKTMKWSIPYAFSMTGVCYRKDKINIKSESDKSWNIFFDNSCMNRICILNDVREIIGIGLKINGYSINTTNDEELVKSLNIMKKFKKVANKMDNIQYKSGIANDEFYICMGYNSDVLQVISEMDNPNISFFIPNEGSTCCFDEMCITKSSQNKELAYKFINFLYKPEISARNCKYICTSIPNKNMWSNMSEEERNNEILNIPETTLKKLEKIKDVGENLKKYNKIWDELKSSK